MTLQRVIIFTLILGVIEKARGLYTIIELVFIDLVFGYFVPVIFYCFSR